MRPTCAACGKPLPKARFRITPDGQSYNPEIGKIFDRKSVEWAKTNDVDHVLTADGRAPERGRYGDNLVCSMPCGHVLAVRIVLSVPGVLDLLPDAWRPGALADVCGEARRAKARERRRARREAASLLADTGKTRRKPRRPAILGADGRPIRLRELTREQGEDAAWYTREEFAAECAAGHLVDDDGYGELAVEPLSVSSIRVWPSQMERAANWWPSWATHVVWYNR